tara:strand:- start:2047 stop:2247 length:201 start_codon:yes stop_codon:yes gene_type:complete
MKLELIIEEPSPKRPRPKEKRHVIIEANAIDTKKLDNFMKVMQDVAEDMGLRAYLDTTEYLLGKDY